MKPYQVITPSGPAYVDFDEVIALGPEFKPVVPTGSGEVGEGKPVREMYLRGGATMLVLDTAQTMQMFLDRSGRPLRRLTSDKMMQPGEMRVTDGEPGGGQG